MKRIAILISIIVLSLLLASCGRPCTPAESGPFAGCCVSQMSGDWCCQQDGGWVCW